MITSEIWRAIESQPPRAAAFIEGDDVVTYGELVRRPVQSRRHLVDVVGDSSVRAALEILDAWRVGDAVLLLHPRVSALEREEISRDVRSAPLAERCHAVVATSGTTGQRRYVLLSEPGMVASAHASAAHLGWREDDRWWLCMPLAHVGGLAIVVRCLLAGRTIVSSPRFDVERYQEALSAGATLMSMVPTMLHALCTAGIARPPESLRAVLVGGGPCTPSLARSARELGLPILLTWGMSEAGSQIATQPLSACRSVSPDDLSTVGRPLDGFEVEIRGGVAWVRGPAATLGYHPPGRYPSPFDDGGWLETKDHVVRADGGVLRILGRGTDMILTGGENVYPAEVEAALAACEHVEAACVVGVPHERWGQEVVAAVVAAESVDERALLRRVREKLGGYKTPRRLIRVDVLPTNSNGKVDRREVARLLSSRRARE